MIPRLAESGTSFKGAALYYLHDKRQEGEDVCATSERVAWTYTLNLPTQDPDRAWRMMAHTAMCQAELKAAAGVKATGRKLTKPVMAFSLAWSPDEEPPTPHEMLEAAQSALAALGLDQHQAIVVAHRDTAHPHVHCIVNRVNPVDGRAHTGSKARLILSAWAEAYERSQGRILCVERVENNARRRGGDKPKRDRKVSRPQWEADAADPARAERVAATHRAMFADQAALERAGQGRRFEELTAFQAKRRAGRNAIRARYQAALDAHRRPDLTPRHAAMADALLNADPARGLQALTRDRSTFTRQDLARHVGRHTASVAEFEAVLSRLETSPDLVAIGRDASGQQRFTTREVQAVERRMEDHAHKLHGRAGDDVRPIWPAGMSLSRDQDAALRQVVGRTGLAAIVGYAGTGKSTMLAAARQSWEAAGLAVIGMTLSGIAADGLRNGSGIESRTIQSRLNQWEKGINLPKPRSVIVVDEAGMIGSRQMERILHFATAAQAKVVLVGDPEQLQAIEAGGAFRSIVSQFGAATLETVRRQREAWQQDATRELATGATATALDRYRAAGMEHEHRTAGDAKAALIARWQEIRTTRPQASQIILAYNRADVRDLNDRARALCRTAGELGPDVSLKTEEGRRSFAAGDRIYFLKNDAGLGVRNGTLATIRRIEGQTIVARLDGEEGRDVVFGLAQYGHIDHGYAATVHKSQGITVDRAHLLATRSLDRHAAYVAMTRHRDRLDVHWSADTFATRAKLVRTLSRAAQKDTSLDYDETPAEAAPIIVGPTGWTQPLREILRRHAANDAPTPQTIGERTRQRLQQDRDAASARAQWASASLGQPAPAVMSPGDAPEPERPTVILTAEMQDYDRITLALARELENRHHAEIAVEAQERAGLVLDAAITWEDARQPVEIEEPADEPKQRALRKLGPSLDI